MNREELETIYQRLDELEIRKIETISHRPKRDLFYWPLAVFFIGGMLYHAFRLIQTRHFL